MQGEWHTGSDTANELVLLMPEGDSSQWYLRPHFTKDPRQLRFTEAYYRFRWARYVSISLD